MYISLLFVRIFNIFFPHLLSTDQWWLSCISHQILVKKIDLPTFIIYLRFVRSIIFSFNDSPLSFGNYYLLRYVILLWLRDTPFYRWGRSANVLNNLLVQRDHTVPSHSLINIQSALLLFHVLTNWDAYNRS